MRIWRAGHPRLAAAQVGYAANHHSAPAIVGTSWTGQLTGIMPRTVQDTKQESSAARARLRARGHPLLEPGTILFIPTQRTQRCLNC